MNLIFMKLLLTFELPPPSLRGNNSHRCNPGTQHSHIVPCTVLMSLVLTPQSILECNFHTHTDLLGHITVIHSQATYNVLIDATKGENAAFRLKSLPTHVLSNVLSQV